MSISIQIPEILQKILSPFGFVKEVGKSFGVLKFISEHGGQEFDFSLPRTEKKTGKGYPVHGTMAYGVHSGNLSPLSFHIHSTLF